jgi:hypothetical protein
MGKNRAWLLTKRHIEEKLDFAKILFLSGMLSLVSVVSLASENVDNETLSGKVEIEIPPEILAPYSERRPDWQITFNFQLENFKPTDLTLGTGAKYNDQFGGKSLSLINFYLGGKYNFPVTAIDLSLNYGAGGGAGQPEGQSGVGILVVKKGVRIALELDQMMREPYVAPYAALSFNAWDYSESSTGQTLNKSTTPQMGFQLGALVQLNSLEEKTALRALREDGLQNTFLDVFVHQYTAETDGIKLTSALSWGLGFKTEY